MKKNLNILGDLWEKLMNMLSTTLARMAVWKLKTWSRQRLDDWMFARVVFPSECTQEHTACADSLCRSGEGTSVNRLWSPRPTTWRGNNSKLTSPHHGLIKWNVSPKLPLASSVKEGNDTKYRNGGLYIIYMVTELLQIHAKFSGV